MAVVAVVVFVSAYILLVTEKIHRVAAALGGAAIMLAAGVVDAEDAFFSKETGVDWNVIFLLLGMMIIVGVLRETGVFEYLAIWAAKKAKGKPFRVMVTFVLLTAVASALLDNVTTVLLVAPVTLLVCLRLGVPPVPFLIAEVLASNIGGAATLIGDPPNIIIASRGNLEFNDFLINMGPIVVVLLVVYLGMCRVLFRRAFRYDEERVAQVMSLNERDAIEDKALLVKSGIVLLLVTLGFALHSTLHTDVSVVALLGAGLLISIAGLAPKEYLGEVEGPTLVFFAGLFIMVGALINVGVIDYLGERACRRPPAVSVLVLAATGAAVRVRPCCPGSSTTSRTSPRWPRWSPGSSTAVPVCRRNVAVVGAGPREPTSAATPRSSGRARTSSYSASPSATATRSASSTSSSTAPSWRR